MLSRLTYFWLSTLTVLMMWLLPHQVHANGLVNDPFVHQHIEKSTFEPGGKNHLFGSRGVVTDRQGDIHLIPTGSIQAGGVSIDQAMVAGYYQYNTKFGNHYHYHHAPFHSSSSRQKTEQQGIVGVDFTSLSMQWKGSEYHPADAYDGEQGSGYPAPTGARDEYSYAVSGSAISVRVTADDHRSFQDRLGDRGKAWDNTKSQVTDALEQGLTHNPELNALGNAAEAGSALAKGVGAVTGLPFELLGSSDVADGLGLARDVALLESLRELPHDRKLTAAKAMQAAQDIQSEYGQWKAQNPNKATAIDMAGDALNAYLKGGRDNKSQAQGDKTTGSRGGGATDTGHANSSGQTIYQRDSGGYYSINPTTGHQQRERSPYEPTISHGGSVTSSDVRGGEGRTLFQESRRNALQQNNGLCEYCQKRESTDGDHIKSAKDFAKDVNEGQLSLKDARIKANSSDNIVGACGGKGGCNQIKGSKALSSTPGPGKFVPSNPTQRVKAIIDKNEQSMEGK